MAPVYVVDLAVDAVVVVVVVGGEEEGRRRLADGPESRRKAVYG